MTEEHWSPFLDRARTDAAYLACAHRWDWRDAVERADRTKDVEDKTIRVSCDACGAERQATVEHCRSMLAVENTRGRTW